MEATKISQIYDEHVKPLPVEQQLQQAEMITEHVSQDSIDEKEWLYSATNNPAFNFLKEPEEDIYTIADGKQFHDKRKNCYRKKSSDEFV